MWVGTDSGFYKAGKEYMNEFQQEHHVSEHMECPLTKSINQLTNQSVILVNQLTNSSIKYLTDQLINDPSNQSIN